MAKMNDFYIYSKNIYYEVEISLNVIMSRFKVCRCVCSPVYPRDCKGTCVDTEKKLYFFPLLNLLFHEVLNAESPADTNNMLVKKKKKMLVFPKTNKI
jgi:hypothetical protein